MKEAAKLLTSVCSFNEAAPLLADDASKYARGHRAHIGKITLRKHAGPRGRGRSRIGEGTYT